MRVNVHVCNISFNFPLLDLPLSQPTSDTDLVYTRDVISRSSSFDFFDKREVQREQSAEVATVSQQNVELQSFIRK